jgi:serine protease Do
MNRKTMIGLLGVITFSLVGVGVMLAQRERVLVTPRARAMVLNMNDGRVRLGVRLADVNAEKVGELKLSGEYGAVVTEVEKDSAAAKAGLAANDVILEFDGERVRSVAQLRRLVQDTPPGRGVEVKISRAGQMRTLNVKLEEASAEQDFQGHEIEIPRVEVPEFHMPDMNFEFFTDGPHLGVSADDLTPQLAEHFGVTQGKGVLVLEVTAGSAAEKAGLKAGDCIVKVGNKNVGSVEDLHRALRDSSSSDEKREVALTVVRDRHEQTLSVQLEPSHRMMTMPRRIAGDESMGIDPSEVIRMKAQLQASGAALQAALQAARKELESQRHKLIEEQLRMQKELRHELERKSLVSSSWTVD